MSFSDSETSLEDSSEILSCRGCGRILNPENHGDLVCDGEIWCDSCRIYPRELLKPRDFKDILEWTEKICTGFGYAPCTVLESLEAAADPSVFRKERTVLMGETDHQGRIIVLYPPGYRLATLCHELAHLFTGHDHTIRWARTYAKIVAWVKERVPPDTDTLGFSVNLLQNPPP